MSQVIRAVGTMSGTSLDGVDAAELVTDGDRIVAFGRTGYRPYDEAERAVLRAALGRWDGPEVERASELVTAAHRELLSGFPDAELVAFHGQTLAHDPRGRGTLQAGNGEALGAALGRPVVWDFRSADVAAGGEGAPLAPFYHFACARHAREARPVAFLNLGGVGNLTLVDPEKPAPEAPGACIAFDTGPANAPIDDWVRERTAAGYDAGGALAARGRVDEPIVSDVLDDPYFAMPPPKSLDRAAFGDRIAAVSGLSLEDGAATLAAVAAACVAAGLSILPAAPARLLVTGGGRRNPTLMRMLAERCGVPVAPVEDLGLDGDMLEAQAFAFLAVRSLGGLPITAPGTTGVAAPMTGGRLSRAPRAAAE